MNSLNKRRPWLGIGEAAEFLSAKLKQNVAAADVLRQALDGALPLCLHLPAPVLAQGWDIDANRPMGPEKPIHGLCNLLFDGAGRVEVERRYNRERGGPDIDLEEEIGALVEQDGAAYQLPPEDGRLGPRNPSAFPFEAVLAVRTEALSAFALACAADPIDTPLEQRERTSLLILIAVLAKRAGITISEAGAAAQIARLTEEIGAPVERKTVQNHLARIPDAIERRRK